MVNSFLETNRENRNLTIEEHEKLILEMLNLPMTSKRDKLVPPYAAALRHPDFKRIEETVNSAIIKRWSLDALRYIKKRASRVTLARPILETKLDSKIWEHKISVPEKKKMVSIRLDTDVTAWFKSQGPNYQTRMNEVLRTYMLWSKEQEQTG